MSSRSKIDRVNRKRKGALRFVVKGCSDLNKYKAVRKKFIGRIKNENTYHSTLF